MVYNTPESRKESTDYPAKVLVVDDDFMNTNVFESLLDELGFSCDIAMSGKAAVAFVESRLKLSQEQPNTSMYSLILMDYSMPDMDGPDVCQLIRTLVPPENQPLICCCSAYGGPNFVQKAMNAGMNKFLCKPVSNAQLIEIIEEAMKV